MRLRNNNNANDKVFQSKYLIKDFPFQINDNYVIELGMGKGEMITELAAQNPDKIFIGIEKFNTVIAKAIRRAKEKNLNNFFVINKDIKYIDEFLTGKCSLIWLTFSDPWPKKKHYKRRLTYKFFLEKYKKILLPKGIVKMKTDNDILFESSLESIREFKGANLLYHTNDLYKDIEKLKNNVPTGYEKKWVEKEKNINYLEFNFK